MMDFLAHLPVAVLVALITSIFGLPSVLLAHRLGMRKQAADADALFDGRMLTALEQRDATISQQNDRLQAMAVAQADLYRDIGAAQAQITALTNNQQQRDDRERQLIAELAELRVHVKSLDECQGIGGTPCPLAHLRRQQK